MGVGASSLLHHVQSRDELPLRRETRSQRQLSKPKYPPPPVLLLPRARPPSRLLLLLIFAAAAPLLWWKLRALPFSALLRAPGLPPPPPPYRCSPSERSAQVALLRPDDSRCYSAHYWPALFAAGFGGCRDIVAVNIGANKGYLLAHWLDLLRPTLNITPAGLHERFLAPPLAGLIDPSFTCGNCYDCKLGHVRTRLGGGAPCAAAPARLRAWAIEPVPGNAALLRGGVAAAVAAAAAAGGGANARAVEVHVEEAAIVGAPAPPTVAVEVCAPGGETCGVREEGAAAEGAPTVFADVPAFTLDGWVEARGLASIDVLAIDTEGLDAPVLAGGAALLARGGVRLLLFEYHDKGAWRRATLQGVVEGLEAHGYDCYLLQNKLALRLTGCWDPAFEFKSWSNVMCAHRAEEALAAALAAFAVVPSLQQD